MRAMVITENGLQLRDVPTPAPGADEVLVRVHAAGLNRAEPVSYTHLTLPTKA